MEVSGEYLIAADRDVVWNALNDPEVLRKCIPGCESLERITENAFEASVTAVVGPVRARFDTSLSLEDLCPPESYRLVGRSKAAAGFGSGSANVRLAEADDGTRLTYEADFKVGGRLAQVGSRLVLGATRKTADDFFSALSREIDSGASRMPKLEVAESHSQRLSRWMTVGSWIAVLLIIWFLLR